jgi:hypothetical protein
VVTPTSVIVPACPPPHQELLSQEGKKKADFVEALLGASYLTAAEQEAAGRQGTTPAADAQPGTLQPQVSW